MSLLAVRDLHVEFDTYGGVVKAVRGVSFALEPGRTLAIVGESGCGKSVTVQACMGLIPSPPGRVTKGSVLFEGQEMLGVSAREANRIRGKKIGMIFQDPMTSLNPTMKVGKQITEALRYHERIRGAEARRRAVELLERVQIPEARTRVDDYPFQFSGGMRQRVMIAMAIACGPSLLIADEPTTALDVTVQAQILNLMKQLQRESGMAIVLITHDLGVVAQMADEVAVMYGGLIVEQGSVDDVFYRPAHPYMLGLQAAMPHGAEGVKERLEPIEGSPPDLFSPPPGCAYFDRCPWAMKVCGPENPPLWPVERGHASRCWLHHEHASARRPAEIFHRELMPAGAPTAAAPAAPAGGTAL
jgi:oligopeptide/dipeptide ABC transporter ATP-binding protein